MRTYYSEYVRHCMRFYARHPCPNFRSEADRHSWEACRDVLGEFSDNERDWLLEAYRERDTLADNVYNLSMRNNVKQDVIWRLIYELERRVAERKNMI